MAVLLLLLMWMYFASKNKYSCKNHHPALASDLMDEWRAVIVDSMVLGLISHNEIKPEHFYSKDDKPGIYLNREGRLGNGR